MYTIGIFGSGEEHQPEELAAMARELGGKLAAQGCIIVTGACSGLPYQAAHAASAAGAEVWGFSPVASMEEQREFTPHDDLAIYSTLHFIPRTFTFNADLLICKKYRNAISTAHCDAGIIIAGAWGTLNEATNLIDYGKAIGVLEGSGGVADELRGLIDRLGTTAGGTMVFNSSPSGIAMNVIAELDRRGGR